jgi:hypothetical protein
MRVVGHRVILCILWCCFVIKGTFYASFLPLWEGYDEFSHFAFVEHLVTRGTLPDRAASGVPRDVSESLRLAPVPWVIKDWEPGWISHDGFWRLSSSETYRRERYLRSLTDTVSGFEERELKLYEGQQPPLAYVLLAAYYLPVRHHSLALRVWVLRLVCVLIASAAIPAGNVLARTVGLNPWEALVVVAAAAAAPELMMTTTHVSNEALALALGTASVAAWMRCCAEQRRAATSGAAVLGLLLACCLLTKAYFLALLLPVFGMLVIKSRRSAAIAAVVALALSSWWYAHNLAATKTISGEQIEVAAQRSHVSLASAASQIHWGPVADFAITSHIWLGGWSFLVLRSWMYRAIEVLLLAAFAGMCLQLLRPAPFLPDRFRLGSLLLLQCVFWAGLVWRALSSYQSTKVAGTLGYYPWCLAVPEVLCLIAGLQRITPGSFRTFCAPFVTLCFAALEVFSTNFLLIPYYGGLIAHRPGGGVPAAHVSALWNALPEPLLSRISFAKPFPLTRPTMVWLWLLFFGGTLAPVGISIFATFRSKQERIPQRFAHHAPQQSASPGG